MIEKVVFSIKDLLSYRDHDTERCMQGLDALSSGYVEIYIPDTKCRTLPSKDQLLFIKHILPVMIQNKVPMLKEVLSVYHLAENSYFYHESASWDPCGYFEEDLQESNKN